MSSLRKRIALAAATLSLTCGGMAWAQQDGEGRGPRRGPGASERGQDADRGGRGGRGGEARGQRGTDRGGRGSGWSGQQRGGFTGGMSWGGRGGGSARGLAQMLTPTWQRRDLQLIVRMLELDREQAVIVETIFDDYETEFEAAAAEARAEFEGLWPQAPELTEEQEARQEELRDEMREMGQRFRSMRQPRGDETGGRPPMTEEEMAELRERFGQIREEMSQFRAPRPEGQELVDIMSDARRIYDRYRSGRAGLDTNFLADLQLLLAEDQFAIWGDLERSLRRSKRIRDGRLSGESVDLFIVKDESGIDEVAEAEISELLSAYSIKLDAAIKARAETLEETRFGMFEAMATRQWEDTVTQMELEQSDRVAVRDINGEFANLIVAQLMQTVGDGPAYAFEDAWRRAAYRRIYNTSWATRVFDAAMELEDVDPQLADAIVDLADAHAQEIAIKNEALVRLTIDTEPQQEIDRMRERIERMQAWASGERGERGRRGDRTGSEDDPIRSLSSEKRDLDERYTEQLMSLLTEDQKAMLPERPQRGRRGGDNGEGRTRGRDRGSRGNDIL